jgi:phage terminase small subunit
MGFENSGRRPRPTALKILRGNPGKRPLNPAEPQPPPGPIEMPAGLAPDARQVWAAIAPICLGMGTLTPADVLAFARHCELEARWKVKVQTNDLASILALSRELRSSGACFGLDPSSRARIQVAPQKPASKWADAL